MVSEQEINKKPQMEESQIHTLELLIETISNLIDLYKANTKQNQNSYQPKNFGVETNPPPPQPLFATHSHPNGEESKESIDDSNSARSKESGGNAESGDAADHEAEETPETAPTDSRFPSDRFRRVYSQKPPEPAVELSEDEQMAAIVGDQSAAPPATDNNFNNFDNSGGSSRRQQHPSQAEAASAVKVVQRGRRKKGRKAGGPKKKPISHFVRTGGLQFPVGNHNIEEVLVKMLRLSGKDGGVLTLIKNCQMPPQI